jgi:hypothetical protein
MVLAALALENSSTPQHLTESPGIGGLMSGSDNAGDEGGVNAPERPSRRSFFVGAAAVATAALVPMRKAQAQRIQRPRPGIMTRPGAPSAADNDAVVRLVNRVTLGATDDEVKRAKAMGFTKYLESQLKYTAIGDSATDAWVQTNAPTISQDGSVIYATDYNTLITQLWSATTYRSAFSKRQLYERMVEFWSDHFNIDYEKVGYLKTLDDRDVIRQARPRQVPRPVEGERAQPGDARVSRQHAQPRPEHESELRARDHGAPHVRRGRWLHAGRCRGAVAHPDRVDDPGARPVRVRSHRPRLHDEDLPLDEFPGAGVERWRGRGSGGRALRSTCCSPTRAPRNTSRRRCSGGCSGTIRRTRS